MFWWKSPCKSGLWGLRMINRNCKGYRIGESHPRARLTNADVELIFELRGEELSITEIAEKMECGRTTVYKIVTGKMRGQAIYQVTRGEERGMV